MGADHELYFAGERMHKMNVGKHSFVLLLQVTLPDFVVFNLALSRDPRNAAVFHCRTRSSN